MLPKLNRKRALFVLTKIDEILAWERRSETERDTRFVELGRYLCEVRAGRSEVPRRAGNQAWLGGARRDADVGDGGHGARREYQLRGAVAA